MFCDPSNVEDFTPLPHSFKAKHTYTHINSFVILNQEQLLSMFPKA